MTLTVTEPFDSSVLSSSVFADSTAVLLPVGIVTTSGPGAVRKLPVSSQLTLTVRSSVGARDTVSVNDTGLPSSTEPATAAIVTAGACGVTGSASPPRVSVALADVAVSPTS